MTDEADPTEPTASPAPWPVGTFLAIPRGGEGLNLTQKREIDDVELADITDAIESVRHRVLESAQLLDEGRQALVAEIESFIRSPASPATPPSSQIPLAAVAWLLIWRLHRDHLRADVARRHRSDPQRSDLFELRRREIYDAHPGYRLAEAMRDYVQHVGSPPIRLETGRSLKPDGSTTQQASVTVDGGRLLDWSKCPATVRRNLEQDPTPRDLLNVVVDGAAGMTALTAARDEIISDRIQAAEARIRSILDECAPEVPIVVTFRDKGDGRFAFTAQPLAEVIAHLGEDPSRAP